MPRDIDLYTTSEMAVRLGISPDKVRRLNYDQKLPAEKVGAAWTIRANSGLSPGSPETLKATGSIQRRKILGGIINDYYRVSDNLVFSNH